MADISVRFCIRTDKPKKRNGRYPVYLRVRLHGKETKIPANIDVSLEQWDAKALHAKQVATRVILEKKRNDILLFEERMRAEGQYATIEDIKNFNSGKSNLKPERQSFFTYFQDYIQRIEKGIDKGEINKETIAKYKTTYKILKEYKPDFRICDIDYNLIENFDLYMTEVRGNAPGGRYNKHKNLRSVILDIIKHGIPVNNPYDTFKIPQPAVKDIYLTLQELDSLRGLRSKLSHKSTDYKILQMYLFSCYCGLRFSDVIELKWNEINFEDGVIQRKMIKTKRLVTTPLFGHAKALLLEISDAKRLLGSEKSVFHPYSSTSVNKTLERLSDMANIDKHITFHTGRHTFATLLAQAAHCEVGVISKCLGHTTLEMAQRYVTYDIATVKNMVKDVDIFG